MKEAALLPLMILLSIALWTIFFTQIGPALVSFVVTGQVQP